ncbi:hypothetical protein [Methylobacter sp.]|uniref:hypothetical protein n=1 Tax=Methylobacter sp. TaxID=2051955 RepID=UPI003DA4F223
MSGSYPDSVNPGLFLSTTPMYDVGDLNDQENLKQLVVKLTQFSNDIAIILNQKDSALYSLEQFVNGQTFFPNPALSSSTEQTPTPRQVFRQVFLTGPLPNTGILLIPHNIAPTALFTFTRIYATASNTTLLEYIPIPFVSTTGNIVSILVDSVNIVITTNFNASGFDVVYVILEWLKN